VLKDAGLVSEERVGKERRYRLNPVPLRQVDSWLSRYESFWGDRLGALRGLLDEQ
jgi:DNA-binding transcriptional ArsR family regulator